ncbi:MAG: right-handed parallel beta-helix repeat-containing protein [Methanobacterium sp.]
MMKNILVVTSFFVVLFLFTGAVSAANWTVNPGDSIQSVIDNASNNDMIIVNDNNGSAYTYNENIIINKTVQLKAKTGGNITVNALNSSNNVFTVNFWANCTTIQGFNIKGATGSNGIYLNGSSNCIIDGNTLLNNNCGIRVDNAINNTIQNNIVKDSYYGVFIKGSNKVIIQNNSITGNVFGVSLDYANNARITGNTITGSTYGIHPQYSTANIQFNRLTGNSLFSIVNQCNSVINATNNWWGTNTPSYIYSAVWVPTPCDIYVQTGTVTYNLWLVLNINSSSNTIIHGGSSNITADLTHNNQGVDTFTMGKLPDNAPINLTTTIGTINIISTKNGKADAVINPNAISGVANVSAILDKQTISKAINIFEIYNNRTNQGFTTIQSAIDNNLTLNSDAIIIGTGTYVENIVINKKITLQSVSSGNVTIQALNSGSAVITINSPGNGTVIQDFTIKGFSNSNAIHFEVTSNCTIAGNTIMNSLDGINSNQSYSNILSNNTITDNSGTGIYLWYSNNNILSGNIVNNNGYCGIKVHFSQNNTIYSSNISNNPNKGIWLDTSNNNKIQFNDIVSNDWDGIHLLSSNNNRIRGNTITEGIRSAIYFGTSSNNNIVTENTIANNDYGLYNDASSNTFNFNRIFGNTKFGLRNMQNGVVNAIKNWWGRTPIYSSNIGNDIYSTSGSVDYGQWFSVDIGFTLDQISTAAATVKNNVETNHQLPGNVSISGVTLNMPQFLKLASSAVLNINRDVSIPTIFGNYDKFYTSSENITNGVILDDEYINMANFVKSYMDNNGYAPDHVSNTSLGDSMGFQSLVYMYSKILSNYTSNRTLPDEINVIPWIAVINPDNVYNFNSQKVFNTIQEAINDIATVDGNIITLSNKTFTENVVINKYITIDSLYETATVNALNTSLPVFKIETNGNGTTIQCLIIKGAINNTGVYINANNVTVCGNNITNNLNGIYINNSTGSSLTGNTIVNNSGNGVIVNACFNTTISDNTVKNCTLGISLNNSNNSTISTNIISDNSNGIYINNSSADIHYNSIALYNGYGLYTVGNGTVNATSNWWGFNNPVISSNNTGDIRINGNNVTCDQLLLLSLTSSCDRSNRNGTCYNYIITAELTPNKHWSLKEGYIPEGIPINVTTTFGVLNVTDTNMGKTAILNSTNSGTAYVTAVLDKQTITIPVNITRADVFGIYNTRTGKGYISIQDAINDTATIDGDTITLADGTYTQNIVINKKLTLTSFLGAKVIFKPLDSTDIIIKINSTANGSTIRGLTLTGGAYSIYMESVSNCNIVGNIISNNFNGIYLLNSTYNTITKNNITDTSVGICYYNSTNNTEAENCILFSEMQNILTIDPTGIVMSSTAYNCGPATLATVLQKLGVNVSQDTLATIADTDEEGTTLYGMVQAAQKYNVFVKSLKLKVNELKKGNIVYITTEGVGHYCIITSINDSIVYLADTDLGNINMTLDEFTEAYVQNITTGYGYVLVITNNSSDLQLSNNNTIYTDDLKAIKGTSYWKYLYMVHVMGYTKYNPLIISIAYNLKRITRFSKSNLVKAQAIYNWMRWNIKYHKHEDTKESAYWVISNKYGNCAEMAGLIINIAKAMGIPSSYVRYVHRPGHYWAQIFCGKNPYRDWWNWKDLDCTMYFSWVNGFGKYVELNSKYKLSARTYPLWDGSWPS